MAYRSYSFHLKKKQEKKPFKVIASGIKSRKHWQKKKKSLYVNVTAHRHGAFLRFVSLSVRFLFDAQKPKING